MAARKRFFTISCIALMSSLVIFGVQSAYTNDTAAQDGNANDAAIKSIEVDDPLTQYPMLLGYKDEGSVAASEYSSFVICHETDGTMSLWAAAEDPKASVLALESDWGVDLQPVEVIDPPFAASMDDWYAENGYPPVGETWLRLWNGPNANSMADWVEVTSIQEDIAGWIRWFLCQKFGIGCADAPSNANDNAADNGNDNVGNDNTNKNGNDNASDDGTDTDDGSDNGTGADDGGDDGSDNGAGSDDGGDDGTGADDGGDDGSDNGAGSDDGGDDGTGADDGGDDGSSGAGGSNAGDGGDDQSGGGGGGGGGGGDDGEEVDPECGFTGVYNWESCNWEWDFFTWCEEIDCGPEPYTINQIDEYEGLLRADSPCNPNGLDYPSVTTTPHLEIVFQDGNNNCQCTATDVSITETRSVTHQVGVEGSVSGGAKSGLLSKLIAEAHVQVTVTANWTGTWTEVISVNEQTTVAPCRVWEFKKYKNKYDGSGITMENTVMVFEEAYHGCYQLQVACCDAVRVGDGAATGWGPAHPEDAGFRQYATCPGGTSCSQTAGQCDTP